MKTLKGLVILGLLLATAACGAAPKKPAAPPKPGPVSVFYAGSLQKVMEGTIGPAFQKATGDTFVGQSSGSTALAQMIISKTGTADVFVSASPGAVTLLEQASPKMASWGIEFARNTLVIAYNPKGPHASLFEQAQKGQIPWYQPLLTPGVKLGRTDPALDPKGASTLFLFQLADITLHRSDLYTQILGSPENPKEVFPETALEANLMGGAVDAAVLYRSEAVGANIPYINLPSDVNLGDPALASLYAKAAWNSPKGVQKGAPIIFAVTIPKNAKNVAGAVAFVRYIVSGKGQAALQTAGLLPMKPLAMGSATSIPSSLRSLVTP